ncbi:hypothetical protein Q0590_06300 [Rhodocytophaga aerolata]|uniref:DUF2157 domain-containing protein n=1 Tax=Rhodocytophaga aerolata TaxID=455078 RepID=A0ABT8R3J8_9BACT|nr:hypothetical protein [Rhodocytophaga aerolata]MDO1445853.1 hypothetical protein [Rhodocytophaga aerolata]
MIYLNKEQTDIIRREVQRQGIKLPGLEEDLVDFLCTAVENELLHEPDFNKAFQQVLNTLTPNELKMTQERTQELLNNKLSSLQIVAYTALALLGFGFVLTMFAMPFATPIILGATALLVVLYFYSNIRWYFTFDNKSWKQKLVFSAGLFVVFLLLLGFIFKLNHFKGADLMMVSSLGILIFLPVFFSIYFFIKQGNTQIKFILPIIQRHRTSLELILIFMLVLGFIARFLLINSLGNMLIIISLFCLSILFTSYTWPYYKPDNKKSLQVLLLFMSIACYVSLLVAALFKIMHWPLPLGRWSDVYCLLLALLTFVWYSRQLIIHKTVRYFLLFICTCLLSGYALLLFLGMSQHQAVAGIIYNIPVLILLTAILLFFYKHTLFKALAVFLFGYYVLAYPYLLMPNKSVIEKVYQYNPEFVELYNQTYENPGNTAQWKQLLEYPHKARNF